MSNTKRDFSIATINELKAIIKQCVDEEDEFFIFDWVHDFFMDELDIQDYVDDVNTYYSHMADKHNINSEALERIIDRVHAVDYNYAYKLNTVYEAMNSFNSKIVNVAQMINPCAVTLDKSEYDALLNGVKDQYKSNVNLEEYIEYIDEQLPELEDMSVFDYISDVSNKSWNSFKALGASLWEAGAERGVKCFDSPYDFVNWITLGVPDIIKSLGEMNIENGQKVMESGSFYDIGNWVSMGTFDMVEGALNPEEPLSAEHWLNSIGLATMVLGLRNVKWSEISVGTTEEVVQLNSIKMSNLADDVAEGVGKADNVITEADRIKQFNLNNCREQMKDALSKCRNELLNNSDAKDIKKICSTADLGDLNLKGEAGSGIWNYNPTIKDYTGVDPREFCKTAEDYTEYYRSLLSDEYLESLPDSFWNGKNKAFIKEDMSKLRSDIERVKSEAIDLGEFNQFGEPSFEYKWNVDNCAEIWSSRDAILKGARYDDLVYRTENLKGGFAEPCDNCQRTFKGTYNIDY